MLVYRFDSRFPDDQKRATALLRAGIQADSVRLPHQAIVEFVAAFTRRRGEEAPLLTAEDARREAEELLTQFVVVYPTEGVVARRGWALFTV